MIFNMSTGGANTADKIKYDNTESSLQSTDVQGAIDEVNSSLSGFSFRKNSEGEKEVSTDGGVTWENFTNGARLLWTNPNPNASFAEQTISCDLTGYNYAIIICKYTPSDDYRGATVIKKDSNISVTNTKMLSIGHVDATRTRSRYVTAINNNGITFSIGMYGANTKDNAVCIPLYIFGLKGSLGIEEYFT